MCKIHHNSLLTFLRCRVRGASERILKTYFTSIAIASRIKRASELAEVKKKKMEKFTCFQVPIGICEKICIIFANGKHILIHLCRHEYVLNFSEENREKANESKSYCQMKTKIESKVKWWRCVRERDGEERKKANERTTQLATAAPFCDIKSILFVRVYFCIHFFFLLLHSPACCYLVENFRGAPPTIWIKGKCWKRYIPAKAGFLLDFSFLFIETTDNLETHFFFIRKKKKKKKTKFFFRFFLWLFSSYQKQNKKRNDEKRNNENGTSHQKWAKKSKRKRRHNKNNTENHLMLWFSNISVSFTHAVSQSVYSS